MIETARKSLEILIARVKRESSAPVIRITAHRCYSASRRNDPGAYIWQQVVKPVVALTEGVEIDYDEKEDGGLPIPKSWDAEAP